MQRLKHWFSAEAASATRSRLSRELARGPIFDFKEFNRTNGKVWPQKSLFIESSKAIQFPALTKELHEACRNSQALLVAICYTAFSDRTVDEFFRSAPTVPKMTIRPIANPFKWLLWSWLMPRTPESIVLRGDVPGSWEALDVRNRLAAYVFLLDRKGRIRWKAAGTPTAEELDSLKTSIETLLSGSSGSV